MTLKRQILANAKYWLDYLRALPEGELLPEPDLRSIAKALEAAAPVPDAWATTKALALAFHVHMERRGYWADWDGFLQNLARYARHRQDPPAEASFLTLQSTIRRQRGHYPDAICAGRRAWWLCRQAGEPFDRAKVLSNLGDLYRLQGCFSRAEMLCGVVVAWFEARRDLAELAQAENRLGLVYFDQRRWAEALPHLIRAETLWRQAPAGDPLGLAKTLHNLGELYRRTGEAEKALAYFGQAIHYYEIVGDEIHIARVQLNIGNIYLNQPDLPQAEATYLQAEAILKRAGDNLDLALARHNLGTVYTRLGNWPEAEACFERAVELWRHQGNPRSLANTLGRLAELYITWGRRAQARACLEEAWQLVRDRPEAYYTSLRRELAEWRSKLNNL